MLKFGIKIAVLIACLLVLPLVLGSLFFPFSWGNPQLNTKIKFIEDNGLNPDTYFIGSSVTNRQIIPSYFDELNGNKKGTSFNLGLDGIMPPFSFYMVEQLMDYDPTIKTIYFELDGFDHMPDGQTYLTTRNKYYLTPKWYFSALSYLKNATMSNDSKLGLLKKYTISFYQKIFNIGMRPDILKQLNGGNIYGGRLLAKYGDGFIPFKTNKTKNTIQRKEIPRNLNLVKGEFSQAFNQTNAKNYNPTFYSMINKAIKDTETKNIQLIFLLNGRWFILEPTNSMVALFNKIPDKNKINLADPNKHPRLYQEKYRWDHDHLNTEGARIYTKKLSHLSQALFK